MAASMMMLSAAACAGASYGERQAAFEASLQSNVGQNSDALLLRYGAPTRTMALNGGGQIFEYSRSETQVSGGGTYTAYDVVRQKRQVRDADGVVREVTDKVQVPVERQSPVVQRTLNCNIRWQVSKDSLVQAVAWDGSDCF